MYGDISVPKAMLVKRCEISEDEFLTYPARQRETRSGLPSRVRGDNFFFPRSTLVPPISTTDDGRSESPLSLSEPEIRQWANASRHDDALCRTVCERGPSKFANKMQRNDRAARIRIARHASRRLARLHAGNPSAPLICNNTGDSWGRRGGLRVFEYNNFATSRVATSPSSPFFTVPLPFRFYGSAGLHP